MNVLDVFSGIGGFSLGLERAGMRTVAFCEIDPYCRAVLRKHWPNVPVFGDVRELTAETVTDAIGGQLRQQSGRRNGSSGSCASQPRQHGAQGIDLICGGFPCQDISVAGKGAGIKGERSGLWSEYARIIGEVRPRYVIVENVAALLGRGIERVLGDLAALGFDAEWHCIPASAVGAPHRRDRVWIVAHAARHVRGEQEASGSERQRVRECDQPGDVAHANRPRLERWLCRSLQECAEQRFAWARNPREVSDTASARQSQPRWPSASLRGRKTLELAGLLGEQRSEWLTEPAMGELVDGLSGGLVRFEGRVAQGVPNRVQKLRALGNAIVPQIAEVIGRAIMAQESMAPA